LKEPTEQAMTNKKAIRQRTPDVCPVCGDDVPRDALACPQCGADHNSGWREDADAYDGVDLPKEDFSYDDFVKEEFGSQAKPAGLKTIWWIVGIALIVALVLYFSAAH
jgi:uncharacterized membrane protein YvbJ